jgi:hypothetical protein|tara:strand:- start:6 stop:176 length:171 start_codon:yes stop_codon:yes gene_type:complete
MKSFYKELEEKRQFFITQLNNKYAALEWAWFQREITDEEYKLRSKDLDARIEQLER